MLPAKKKGRRWNWEDRQNLKFLLNEGFTVTYISENHLRFSTTAIYEEIKRGIGEEDYSMKRYLKYQPEDEPQSII